MAAAGDPVDVGRPEEFHLRQFVAARTRRDETGMRRWWRDLVIDVYDRMDGLVAGQHRGRLDADEHELAVQKAMIRFADNLIWTFRGSSWGELVNATKRLAAGICMDVQRTSMRRHDHEQAVLDAPQDADAGAQHRGEVGEAAAQYERDEERRAAADWVGWALDRLEPEERRLVELTRDGATTEEMMAEFGIERDALYQRRTRVIKKLRGLGGPDA